MSASSTPLYRPLRILFGGLLRAFFKEIRVRGAERVPATGGGVLVSRHPNGLVDPALILARFPRRVVFGARDGLFRWPLLGWAMRAIGTVPIRRAIDAGTGGDPEARRAANRASLDALAAEVAGESFAALFPEGISHDEPGLTPLKAGVAHLYYRARERTPPGAPVPALIPVGLHYDRKNRFRSRALVVFHPPLALPPALDVTPAPDESDDTARARAEALTEHLAAVLREAVGATEDWRTHGFLRRIASLTRAERAARAGRIVERATLEEEAAGFAEARARWGQAEGAGAEAAALLRRRVERYDAVLRTLDVEDHELDRDPRLVSRWLPALLIAQAVLVYFLLPPVLVVGLLNAPTALLLRGLARVTAAMRKDEATIKVLAGVIAYPLTWIAVGIAGVRLHEALDTEWALPDAPLAAGAVLALLCALGGAASLRYLRVARETARALRVRLTRVQRARTFARMREERARSFERWEALALAPAERNAIAR